MEFKKAFDLMKQGMKMNYLHGVVIGIGMMKRKQ